MLIGQFIISVITNDHTQLILFNKENRILNNKIMTTDVIDLQRRRMNVARSRENRSIAGLRYGAWPSLVLDVLPCRL